MNVAEYKAMLNKSKSKYNARRTCGYPSGLEAQRAGELKLLEQAGEIRNLREQPVVLLTRAEVSYRPDFCYEEKLNVQVPRESVIDPKTGCASYVIVYKPKTKWLVVFEDTKGVETERFRIVCKLWAVYGPAPLRIMVRQGKRIVLQKEIKVDENAKHNRMSMLWNLRANRVQQLRWPPDSQAEVRVNGSLALSNQDSPEDQ